MHEYYGKNHYTDYAELTDKPVTPGVHDVVYIPQTIADGWQAVCSCGEWSGFASFYDYPSKETLLSVLKAAVEKHKNSGRVSE